MRLPKVQEQPRQQEPADADAFVTETLRVLWPESRGRDGEDDKPEPSQSSQ